MKRVYDTNWTEEQLNAIEGRGSNLLVAAAAGSGKTAVLVERIITLITDEEYDVDIDKLLIVTFTNAAASEMRERIGERIEKELDKNPASKKLQRQITLLNNASITTLHSFCLKVIRDNFNLIDLDPKFKIADSTEEVILKEEALEELFEKKYEEEDFLKLVECYGGSKSDKALEDIIFRLYSFVMSSPWPEEWLDDASESFNIDEDFNFYDSKWGQIIKEIVKVELYSSLKLIEKGIDICSGDDGLLPYEETLLKDREEISELINAFSDNFNSFYQSFSYFKLDKIKRCKKGADENSREAVKKIRDKVKEKLETLRENHFFMSTDDIASTIKNLYPLMKTLTDTVKEFSKLYSKKKRDKNILDFNDLEHFALNILCKKDEDKKIHPTDISLDFRKKYKEVMVDEYQDSNTVQEVIIDMVSKKHTDEPNVFMVGDVKQSIYRFRQAEPELFLEKYNSYKREEGEKNRKITLYKNFRSRKEVIDGVNYIFKMVMSKAVGEIPYTKEEELNLGADYKESPEGLIVGGPIQLHLLEKDKEDEEGEYEEDLTNIQLEGRMVGKIIKDLVENEKTPFMVYDKNLKKERRVKYKDIVILLRATSNWGEFFSEELEAMGIPVYADTNTGYFKTLEVQTILSLLQIIDNPRQDIPLLAVLRSPIYSFTAEELIDIRLMDEKVSFYEALKLIEESDHNEEFEKGTKEKVNRFLENLLKWRKKAEYMPIDELIWYLYMDTGYFAYVAGMPGGMQRQANLKILFQRAKSYEETSLKGLFNFILFINKLKESSSDMGSAKIVGENEDVIRIMSIHKSKGLEFPVVILASLSKRFNLQDINRNILFHKDLGIGPDYVDYDKRLSYPTAIKKAIMEKIKLQSLSEEMRVLYVALTRAKEKLILTGQVKDFNSTVENWYFKGGNGEGEDKIPEFEVMGGRSYLDWIGPALIRHKYFNDLRKEMNPTLISEASLVADPSMWTLKLWDKKALSLKNGEEEERVINLAKEGESEFKKEIYRRLDYQYEYALASRLPSNLSVSEAKGYRNREYDEEEDTAYDYSYNLFEPALIKLPKFLDGEKKLTGAEKGTIMHFVMEHIDFLKVNSIEEIKEQINYMVSEKFINESDAQAVKPYKILNFFKSDLGNRLINSKKVYREFPFYIEVGAREIFKELPLKYEEEKMVLRGVIDCFFEEEDSIILIDYKTDYVEGDNLEGIKEKYKVQLDYYKRALENITNKKVKGRFIYLFSKEKIVEC